jgi:riboflavin kinase/FMN adenylyltransferase
MKTIHLNADNLSYWQKSSEDKVTALGNFDGLHRGHCKVIETAKQRSVEKNFPLAVMSFFPHPRTVIGPRNGDFPYLMPLHEKEKKLRQMGVDYFYIVEFTKDFASLSPEAFIQEYLIRLGVQHVVAGFDFTYGCKGTGNMDNMKEYSSGKVNVTKVKKVVHQGEKIGSSAIRQRILAGHLEEVPYLLKKNYETCCSWDGTVLKPDNYCIIPNKGSYYVTLKNDSRTHHTIVQIVHRENEKVLKCNGQNLLMSLGNVIVEWHGKVRKSTVGTI